MLQDGLLQAESLAQTISMETEASHLRNNPEGTSHHVAMFFDGSTLKTQEAYHEFHASQFRELPREV